MVRTPEGASARDRVTSFRLAPSEVTALDAQRAKRGGMDRSAYVRYLIRLDGDKIERERGAKRDLSR